MKLKICGVTREEDARCVAQNGADYIGVILVHGSKRAVTPEQAATLLAAGTPAKGVLVVRDMPLAELQWLIDTIKPYAVQLHGSESPDYAARLTGVHVWRAFNLTTRASLQDALAFPADVILADSGGGTGIPCDWSYAADQSRQRTVFLAGGLTLDNLADAIRSVCPAGVDLAGGTEAAPGVKDHQKIIAITQLIHNTTWRNE